MPDSHPVPPLRILAALPQPGDLPRFDADRSWHELEAALKPLMDHGTIVLERLMPPTEAALSKRLKSSPVHVFHFCGHGRARVAANYSTLAFEGQDGQARHVNSQYLGTLLATRPDLRLVFLQAGEDTVAQMGPVAAALVNNGMAAAVGTGLLQGHRQAVFVAKFYAELLQGLTAAAVLVEARTALAASQTDGCELRIEAYLPDEVLFPITVPAAAPTPAAIASPVLSSANPAADVARLKLKQKRAAGEFDVFLCHNSADKPAVKRLGQQLKERGLLPWLDEWELPPGQAWQPLLEQQIGRIQAAAVCFGAAGVGPWQEQEMYGFLRAFVSRKCPVIPVLLADAPSQPALPVFLQAMTWVDFRAMDPNPLDRLVWGVTGRRPED